VRFGFHHFTPSASRPQTGWLVLLLLLAALVPSGCLVWFMNQAVRNEKFAVRQQLMEVYRGNLALAQGRLETWRIQTIHDAETNPLSGAALFASIVRGGIADSMICYDASNHVVYPAPGKTVKASPGVESLRARAKKLIADGKAIELIGLQESKATDEEGRLIVPSLELMAVEQNRSEPLLDDLVEALNNYENEMPAAQRRFLMRDVQAHFTNVVFPTLAAENLAAQYLEKRRDMLQLTAGNGRLALLFQRQTLEKYLSNSITSPAQPAGVSLTLASPGEGLANYILSVPAGGTFPDWRLALTLRDGNIFESVAHEQVASYVWISALTVGVVVLLAVLGAGLIRRQAAVARLRNDLLANVTHELKTPLSSMRLLVDTLLQSQPLHEKTAREYLQLIAAENLRLSRLIDNFLTFSRIERNKHVFDFTRVSPGTIAERAASAVRERFAAGGCQFVLSDTPGLPPLLADADALVTVLINLLDNAWKYSGDDKQITLSAGWEGGSIVFAVKDNGIGLTPRETKRIFKRFYQVDQLLARTGGGCGLGLSIVHYIVAAHHGAVRVESEPSRGSTFFVTLPAAPPEVAS